MTKKAAAPDTEMVSGVSLKDEIAACDARGTLEPALSLYEKGRADGIQWAMDNIGILHDGFAIWMHQYIGKATTPDGVELEITAGHGGIVIHAPGSKQFQIPLQNLFQLAIDAGVLS